MRYSIPHVALKELALVHLLHVPVSLTCNETRSSIKYYNTGIIISYHPGTRPRPSLRQDLPACLVHEGNHSRSNPAARQSAHSGKTGHSIPYRSTRYLSRYPNHPVCPPHSWLLRKGNVTIGMPTSCRTFIYWNTL